MRRFRWNPEKNEALKAARGISSERIVLAIEDGDVLDVLRNPNEGRHPSQLILVVAVEGYAYLVPCVEELDVSPAHRVAIAPHDDGDRRGCLLERGQRWPCCDDHVHRSRRSPAEGGGSGGRSAPWCATWPTNAGCGKRSRRRPPPWAGSTAWSTARGSTCCAASRR